MQINSIDIFNRNNYKSGYKKIAKNNILFKANIPKSEILKMGYIPISIQNFGLQTKSDKIIIDSADKFIAYTNSPNMWNKKVILSDDIDLNGAKIKPIGNSERPFSGEFDGNGCKISNFSVIADSDSYNVGLFGKCQNAQLSNIEIYNAHILGGQQVGGIVGLARDSKFDNCFFQGFIQGKKNIGGLIGTSKNNEIKNSATTCNIDSISDEDFNPFDFNENINQTGIMGGLIGSDDSSKISNSYTVSTLKGQEQIGGFIGYATSTTIDNSSFNGIIIGDKKVGSMIGWAENTNISKSYSLSNQKRFFGLDINNLTSQIYYSLDELMSSPNCYWDSSIWHKVENKLPRLKIKEKRMSSKELFLEDINNDISTGRIEKTKEYLNDDCLCRFDLNPPKHFEENNEILTEIKESNDSNFLFQLFGKIALKIRDERYCNKDNGQYNELLLELVKNPNMDLNRRFEYGYNITCTPLFILTCLNQAYVLQEALKRDDVDIEVGSGFSENQLAIDQAIKYHIDACVYVFLKEPKLMKFIKPKLNYYKSMELSPFIKALFERYPKLPEYNKSKGGIEFILNIDIPPELTEPLKEVSSLEDVQKTIEIDPNYTDSCGNNIANVAVNLLNYEDIEGFRTIIAADDIGTNLENVNNKFESVYSQALRNSKTHIVGYLISNILTPYLRTPDGVDAMLLFSNIPEEKFSLNYMELARKRGLSVNSQANDGTTPLMNAINLKHYETMKYLLNHGANPDICDAFNQTALHKACMNGDETAINILLDVYAYPNIVDESGLKPIEYLDDELLKKYKEKFENLDYFYKIAKCDEITQPDNSIHNFDEYEVIYDPEGFERAISGFEGEKFNEAVQLLSRNVLLNYTTKSRTDSDGNNVLHLVAGVKSSYAKELIKLAIDENYDIDKQNQYGETPLIKALDSYLSAITTEEKIILMQNIKAILDANPNVDLTDINKQGALHRICQSGNPLLLIEILRLNPKINQVDSQGYTPFDYIPIDTDNPMRQIISEYLEENNVIRKKK